MTDARIPSGGRMWFRVCDCLSVEEHIRFVADVGDDYLKCVLRRNLCNAISEETRVCLHHKLTKFDFDKPMSFGSNFHECLHARL